MSTVPPGLVSTIITVYNRPRLVREAVASVLAQTYRPIEIVLVDDGSTDDTPGVCDALAAAHPDVIRVVHQPNQGPAAASNAGLAHITGEFVQFLDSDDVLLPGKFARQVAGLREHPDCGIAYGKTREYAWGQPWSGLPGRNTGHAYATMFPWMLRGRLWPTLSPLYRRSIVDDNGPFLNVRIYQDWEFDCRAARRAVRLHYCDEYVADVRHLHAIEGRKKGDATGTKLPELALVLERILDHGRAAGVEAREIDKFSRRLLEAAERCVVAGFDGEAEHLWRLSYDAAAPARQARLAAYKRLVTVTGWRRTACWRLRIERSRAADAWRAARTVPRVWYGAWRHRVREAAATVAGRPLHRWPGLLRQRWIHRRSRQRVPA